MLLSPLPIVAIASVFSTLTIEVDERELRHRFGLGVWTRRAPVDEIVEARRTTSSWMEG